MKRLRQSLLGYFLLFALMGNTADIYVSPTGADNNDGSKDKPLASLNMALRKAREMRRLTDFSTATIRIILIGGIYHLKEPVFIRTEDSGAAGHATIIMAAPGEEPVLSGGIQITGWKKLLTAIPGLSPKARNNVWVADLKSVSTQTLDFRQLWINNIKGVRAKDANGETMNRIISWNKKEQTCWIPTPKIPGFSSIKGAEFFIHQWWAIAILRIKKMNVQGDSTQLFFEQPESRIQSEHPWPAPWISRETGNSAFYLTNALPFLDEPGEWWLDKQAQKLYYWPRKNEQLATAEVIAPVLENLLQIQGTAEHPVRNVFIKGLRFQHTGWLRPSQQGHVPHQNGLFMTDAYRLNPPGTKEKPGLDNQAWVGRPAAALSVAYATGVSVDECYFEHLASTGIDFHRGIRECLIRGNLLKDIGGNGILAGVYSDPGHEIHLPFNPSDTRDHCSNLTITDNLVTDVTNEDWSCVGIGLGYTQHSLVTNNEVNNVSYSGITMGWGWSPAPNIMKNNLIYRNRIHHYGKHNYDCSGIYTLSAQPGSRISENYIDSIYRAPYAHLPSHWFYIYTDEGSSGFTVSNNFTPSAKYLQNAAGPDNTWTNNGPAVNDSVKSNAGITSNYRSLLKESVSADPSLSVNEEHSEVLELITREGVQPDLNKLKLLLAANQMDSTALYQWKNHIVYFGKLQDLGVMQGRIQNNFPETEVKAYHDLFYQYSKEKHCTDKSVAKEWDHILLSTNLVADPKMQQEYLDYHATQFEKWPELSRGFCNADFQQLLIFRNGRQLVLVISIPKGESLDKLNPKTTENNPRVNEWNKLMGKYQEGLYGAGEGVKWVFLEKIENSK